MPYKDPHKRYLATLKSRAKKPELYKALDLKKGRARSQRGYHIFRRYGLTREAWEKIRDDQLGRCKICGEPPTMLTRQSSVLHVDHNHITGKVRGLLCQRCNIVVGVLEKQQTILTKALFYLEKNN